MFILPISLTITYCLQSGTCSREKEFMTYAEVSSVGFHTAEIRQFITLAAPHPPSPLRNSIIRIFFIEAKKTNLYILTQNDHWVVIVELSLSLYLSPRTLREGERWRECEGGALSCSPLT